MTLGFDLRHLHATPGNARFSEDRRYRYLLTRRWDTGPSLLFLDLCPGPAAEHHEDPFTKSYTAIARHFGYGGYSVVCLYAAVGVAEDLASHCDPIGPDNDRWIDRAARSHDVIVFAWGTTPSRGRARQVASRIWRTCQKTGASVAAAGWSSDGQPNNVRGLDNFTLSTLTGNYHSDFRDVDPRWIDLLADTTDVAA